VTETEIRSAIKDAMKSRDSLRTRVLRNVLSGVKNKMIETRTALTEAEVAAVIGREAKQTRETLDFALKAEREESVAELRQTLAVIESLLPQQLSPAELEQVISGFVEGGAADLGSVMRKLKEEYGGRYDGKLASTVARELLGRA